MGRDKALLRLGGEPMAARVSKALGSAGAARVIAVGGDAAALSGAGLAVVADIWPGEGPLGGVVTALECLDHDVVLVAACDLAHPSPAALAATVACVREAPHADVAVPVSGGRRHWVHAAWRRSTRDALVGQFDAGVRALHRAVERAGLAVVEVEGVNPAGLVDVDVPGDVPT